MEEIIVPPPPKITRTDGSPPPVPKRSREHPPSPTENADPTSAGDGKSHVSFFILFIVYGMTFITCLLFRNLCQLKKPTELELS